MNELLLWVLGALIITVAVIGIGVIEENDMKKLNNIFKETDLNNKFQVMNYLTQLQAKPAWRVCLMIALIGAYILALIYRTLEDIPSIIFFILMVAFIWIFSCAAHSYWGYHCVLPNGSEDTIAALCRCAPAPPNVKTTMYE